MNIDSTASLGKRHSVWPISLEEATAMREATENEIPTAIDFLAYHLISQGLKTSIRTANSTDDGPPLIIILVSEITEPQLNAMSIPLSHPDAVNGWTMKDFAVTLNNSSVYSNRTETMNLGIKTYKKNKHKHSWVYPLATNTNVTGTTSFQPFVTQTYDNFSSFLDDYYDLQSKEFNSTPTKYQIKHYDLVLSL